MRSNWDKRPPPGGTNDDPMCINYECPSAFSCRRFSQEPYQGGRGTVFIDPEPTLLNGRLCEDFDPDVPSPASADTRPKGGDSTQIEAPFTSGAVPEGETP